MEAEDVVVFQYCTVLLQRMAATTEAPGLLRALQAASSNLKTILQLSINTHPFL